jgi:hypothetical protein
MRGKLLITMSGCPGAADQSWLRCCFEADQQRGGTSRGVLGWTRLESPHRSGGDACFVPGMRESSAPPAVQPLVVRSDSLRGALRDARIRSESGSGVPLGDHLVLWGAGSFRPRSSR